MKGPGKDVRVAAWVFITLAGVLAYVNTSDGHFVWDDASSILLHRHVQLMRDGADVPLSDPSKLVQLFKEDQHAFGLGQGNFYRPLVSLSFVIDFLLSYDPDSTPETAPLQHTLPTFIFHLTNLAWHLAAMTFLFLLIGRSGAPFAVQAAACLLFVLHPLHTEAVAYISGRADMMSAACMFAALYFSLGRHGRATVSSCVCMTLAFIAALMCKESATALPLLLAVFVLLRPRTVESNGEPAGKPLARLLPFSISLAVLATYVALRMTVLRFAEPQESAAAPLAQRIVEAGQALAAYARLLFVPTGLHMEQTLDGVPAWAAFAGYAFLGTLVVLAFLAKRSGHWRIAAGFAWFILTWLPISGLFPLNAPLAEHWLYVPMAGFWWAAAELAVLAVARRPLLARAAVAGVALLSLAFLHWTALRNQDWHSNATIYRSTLAMNPGSQRVQANLATTCKTETGNMAGAARHTAESLRLIEESRAARHSTAQFLNETYFRTSFALLKLAETCEAPALARNLTCLQALAAFRAVPAPAAAQLEDMPLRSIVAPLGEAYACLMLGEFERAESGFREAFLGTADPALAPAAPPANQTLPRADQVRALAASASFRRAQALFESAIPAGWPLRSVVRAMNPETLLWPHRPEAFWRKLVESQAGNRAAP